MFDLAIVGGGFSGSMLLANLARLGYAGSIAFIDASGESPRGAAYGTMHAEHLLNVPAAKMGAFADDIPAFHRWCVAHTPYHAPDAFVPRMLYGEYLASIHQESLGALAPTCITQQVAHIQSGAHHTLRFADGTSIEARSIAITSGNPFPVSNDPRYITTPWRFDYSSIADQRFDAPIAIIGTGLTAVDTLLSLRAYRVHAPIVFVSRHGHFPQPHRMDAAPATLALSAFEGLSLSAMMQRLRHAARSEAAWQSAMDAMRPHTQPLWHAMPVPEKRRFLRRLRHYWDIHRHRMAPSIHAILQDALRSGEARVVAARVKAFGPPPLTLIHGDSEQVLDAALVFDCTGPRHHPAAQPMLAGLLEQGIIAPSPAGLGLATHAPYRVSRDGVAPIYALGPMLMGDWFESTAVPELRGQAAVLAQIVNEK